MIRVGTAGWTIPRALQDRFPTEGWHLERYARAMEGVEINSSFHRPHRRTTYGRWADETPDGFRFAVKLPRSITHEKKLRDIDDALDRFVDEVGGLGDKLGVLLVQLPPSSAFAIEVVEPFFIALRSRHAGAVVCEPRHASWFDARADDLLVAHRIGRVAADPALSDAAARPGGWRGDATAPGCLYYRWHGTPRVYRSAYDDAWLARRAAEVLADTRAEIAGRDAWCMFDNTAAGAALDDALRFAALTGVVTR